MIPHILICAYVYLHVHCMCGYTHKHVHMCACMCVLQEEEKEQGAVWYWETDDFRTYVDVVQRLWAFSCDMSRAQPVWPHVLPNRHSPSGVSGTISEWQLRSNRTRPSYRSIPLSSTQFNEKLECVI